MQRKAEEEAAHQGGLLLFSYVGGHSLPASILPS